MACTKAKGLKRYSCFMYFYVIDFNVMITIVVTVPLGRDVAETSLVHQRCAESFAKSCGESALCCQQSLSQRSCQVNLGRIFFTK